MLRELEQWDPQTPADRPVGPEPLAIERGKVAEGLLLRLGGGVEEGPEEEVMGFPAVPASEGAGDVVSLARRPAVEEEERVDGEAVLPAEPAPGSVVQWKDAVAEAAIGLAIDAYQACRAAGARGAVLEALVGVEGEEAAVRGLPAKRGAGRGRSGLGLLRPGRSHGRR